jgi:hypothetical protein
MVATCSKLLKFAKSVLIGYIMSLGSSSVQLQGRFFPTAATGLQNTTSIIGIDDSFFPKFLLQWNTIYAVAVPTTIIWGIDRDRS